MEGMAVLGLFYLIGVIVTEYRDMTNQRKADR
jgi:hypothetical protein